MVNWSVCCKPTNVLTFFELLIESQSFKEAHKTLAKFNFAKDFKHVTILIKKLAANRI